MKRVYLSLLGVILSGCSSFSAMQTARVIPEGQYRLFLGGSFFKSPEAGNGDAVPFVEGGARFGFTEGWDLGVRYGLPGTLIGDIRFMPYSDDQWAFSTGFGFGYTAVGREGDAVFPSAFHEFIIPAYVSYDVSQQFGVYLSPRAVIRQIVNQQLLIGGSLGTRFGNSTGLMVEISGAKDLRSQYSQFQVGVGFFFGNAESVPNTSADRSPKGSAKR